MAAGSAARKPADVCSARKPELFASTSEAAAAPGVVAAVELDPVGTVEAAPDAAAAPEAEFADEAGALEFTRVSVPAACLSIRDNEDPAAVTGSVALEAFASDDYDGAILTSNAFGGAHAAMLLAHD